jgi:hypothetical protein
MPNWSTDEILAVHVRMHKAEGALFRDVLVAGARACDLKLPPPPPLRIWTGFRTITAEFRPRREAGRQGD